MRRRPRRRSATRESCATRRVRRAERGAGDHQCTRSRLGIIRTQKGDLSAIRRQIWRAVDPRHNPSRRTAEEGNLIDRPGGIVAPFHAEEDRRAVAREGQAPIPDRAPGISSSGFVPSTCRTQRLCSVGVVWLHVRRLSRVETLGSGTGTTSRPSIPEKSFGLQV